MKKIIILLIVLFTYTAHAGDIFINASMGAGSKSTSANVGVDYYFTNYFGLGASYNYTYHKESDYTANIHGEKVKLILRHGVGINSSSKLIGKVFTGINHKTFKFSGNDTQNKTYFLAGAGVGIQTGKVYVGFDYERLIGDNPVFNLSSGRKAEYDVNSSQLGFSIGIMF